MTNKTEIISTSGNTQPANIPFCILSPALWEILPTTAGPSAPPISPAIARSANMAVPPEGILAEQMLIVPGHIIPTEKPHTMQPTSPSRGISDKDAVIYDGIKS